VPEVELELEEDGPEVGRATCLLCELDATLPPAGPGLGGSCAPTGMENHPGGIPDDPINGGVTPHTIVIGHATGDGERVSPVLRARTAPRRCGYHVGAVGARVGKSRI
jgi:hypothetical protein